MGLEIGRRLIDGIWRTGSADESEAGPGGSLPDPILVPVNIEVDTSAVGQTDALAIQDVTEPGQIFLNVAQNSDGAGNVDSALALSALGTGGSAVLGTDATKDGYFQWFTAYGWSHQPRSDDPDNAQSFVLYDKNGDELIEGRAGAKLGFFNTAPVVQPSVSASSPTLAADLLDALDALGLVNKTA